MKDCPNSCLEYAEVDNLASDGDDVNDRPKSCLELAAVVGPVPGSVR